MATILHIADYAAPYSGNFIAEIRAYARASRELGLQSALALPPAAANRDWISLLTADKIPVYQIPDPQYFGSVSRALAVMVRRQNIVILHTHFNRRYEVASAIARILSGNPGLLLIWHRRSDGPFFPTLATRAKNFVVNRLLAPDVHVIALSQELERQAIATGILPGRVATLFTGIDMVLATAFSRCRDEVRSAWAVTGNVPVALHFGWEPGIKGVDLILGAAKKLGGANPPFIIVMVGWEATIAAARKILGAAMPAWLRIVPPVENIADYYHAADLMVSTSRYEGFSGCVAQAMAAGLPVLTTDIRGLQWAAASDGVRFVDLDESSIASGLEAMLCASPHMKQRWSEANRSLIANNYELGHIANVICELYRSLLTDCYSASVEPHREMVS